MKLQDLPVRKNIQISTEIYPSQAQEQTFYISETQVTPSNLLFPHSATAKSGLKELNCGGTADLLAAEGDLGIRVANFVPLVQNDVVPVVGQQHLLLDHEGAEGGHQDAIRLDDAPHQLGLQGRQAAPFTSQGMQRFSCIYLRCLALAMILFCLR